MTLLPSGSTSVMARRVEPPDSLDFFPTPPWATRALLSLVLPRVLDGMHICSAWEPACGEGHMVEVLVLAIRADPRSQRTLAAVYAVGPSTIAMVRSGRNWAHLRSTAE